MLPSPRHAARSRVARRRPAGGAPGLPSGAGRLISVVRRQVAVAICAVAVVGCQSGTCLQVVNEPDAQLRVVVAGCDPALCYWSCVVSASGIGAASPNRSWHCFSVNSHSVARAVADIASDLAGRPPVRNLAERSSASLHLEVVAGASKQAGLLEAFSQDHREAIASALERAFAQSEGASDARVLAQILRNHRED